MNLGMGEGLAILFLIVILYGERLPEITKRTGKTFYKLKNNFEEAKGELMNFEVEQEKESFKEIENSLPYNNKDLIG